MALLAVLFGCADKETVEPAPVVGTDDEPVAVSLAFSLPELSAGRTRMADSVVQTSADLYRGLKDVRIIPFRVPGTITADHVPFVFDYTGGDERGRVTGKPSELTPSAFYYYSDCAFWSGTTSLLFYALGANTVMVNGAAIPATDKSYYGAVTTSYLEGNSPTQIQFGPEQISPTTAVSERAEALAAYLTSIARTTGWTTTDDPKLKALYLDFIRQHEQGGFAVIGGSSASVRAFVEELYTEVGKNETVAANSLVAAIRTSITAGADVDDDGHVTLTTWNGTPLTDYPSHIGLPDGAAAMQWDGTAFVAQTQTTVETAITSVDRFAYPAELCYYGNSTIQTSSDDVVASDYQSAATWDDVLTRYTSGPVITSGTKSAAMVTPVQYGVARLSVRLKNIEIVPFLDADDKLVSFNDSYYPLTAVIIGGQYPVGFDFRPETVQPWPATEEASDEMTDQMLFIYDPQVRTRKAADGKTYDYYCLSSSGDVGNTNTLVFQTYEKKNVKIVLEFENRSGKKFMGYDGIVYPGTKFYMIGEVNPVTATTGVTAEDKNRVFTQDYTTTFDVQVENFKSAYNVMPDLLAPRMEIGVKVANWETIHPTTVEITK